VLVGFHERKSGYVADMKECHVLPPHVSALLLPLRALITNMDAIETIPQIELACGDAVIALVLRHMEPLSDGDLSCCVNLHEAMPGSVVVAAKGLDTVHLLDEGGAS